MGLVRFLYPVASISFDKYIDELRTEFPVYGDFLGFFNIRIGDMPFDMASRLIKIAAFYEELKGIRCNMLDAYVKFALLKAGYVSLDWLELAKDEAAEGEDPKVIAREDMMGFIRDVLMTGEEIIYITVDEYINLENPKECIRVKLFSFQPGFWNDKVVFGWWGEKKKDELIEKLTEPVDGYNFESISSLMVVDPLIYRLAKDFVRKLKMELEEKLGKNILLSTHEFLNLLALDRENFEADWSDLREITIKRLKEKYPFISVYEETLRINFAQKEIREALADLSKTELKESDCRELIWRVSNAIEAYLGVLYHRWKNRPPEERGFGWLLNSLRNEIEAEFGEDVYNDLSFIKDKRNTVSHPKTIKITIDDTIKVVRRAEIFQRLFLMKLYT